MVITPTDIRRELGLEEIPAPAGEDANDRTEREMLNARSLALATRLHAVASAAVERYAPAAPEAIRDESVIRVASYLHSDNPDSRMLRRMEVPEAVSLEFRAVGSALRLSGSMALLSPYRVRRAPTATEATS